VILLIADTGIGIAPESLRRLGKPFEQVESQLTKTYHGSGLGLAIAKSLANLHGGSMKLRSTLGVGTVVCVLAAARRQGQGEGSGQRLDLPYLARSQRDKRQPFRKSSTCKTDIGKNGNYDLPPVIGLRFWGERRAGQRHGTKTCPGTCANCRTKRWRRFPNETIN